MRYFGGIKLGTPGLIAAYRETARQALDDAGTREMYETERIEVMFPYMCADGVMKIVKGEGAGVACGRAAATSRRSGGSRGPAYRAGGDARRRGRSLRAAERADFKKIWLIIRIFRPKLLQIEKKLRYLHRQTGNDPSRGFSREAYISENQSKTII